MWKQYSFVWMKCEDKLVIFWTWRWDLQTIYPSLCLILLVTGSWEGLQGTPKYVGASTGWALWTGALDGAPFCLCSLHIWRSVSPNVCRRWALCNMAASSQTADQEGSVLNMWILMKVIRMHIWTFAFSCSHVSFFSSWKVLITSHCYTSQCCQNNIREKSRGEFLQDSVFYNVFQNILYNTFGVTKKGSCSFDPFLISVSLNFAPLLWSALDIIFFLLLCILSVLYTLKKYLF